MRRRRKIQKMQKLPACLLRYRTLIFSLLLLFLFSGIINVLAAPSGGYAPGATLDPDCAPGSSANCTVNPIVIGGTISSATVGSILFAGTGGILAQDNSNLFWDDTNNSLGIGTVSPTARLHLPAGTATANTAPFKFTSGTNLTTAEAGAMEWDGTNLFITQTSGPTRKTIAYTDSIITSSMYIGTTQVALNRASAALTLAGITLTTPEIGSATGTSLDLGTTTLYGSRAITVDTGGVFNIDLSSASGDDFTVDTNKLVVEGDTGNIGIGTTTPDVLLDIGEAGTTLGVIRLAGSTSGNVTINPAVVAGSWTLTLPSNDGDSGQFLQTNGSGVSTWATALTAETDPLSWKLLGNASTVDGTNFIGTTDNIPLNFRVNNEKAGRIDPTLYNTFFGYQSGNSNTLGNYNTANGYKSLYLNTSASYNVAIGSYALYKQSYDGGVAWNSGNVAIGYQALFSTNSTTGNNGIYNTAIGYQALVANTTGGDNYALGYQAMFKNTTGADNVAIGTAVLYSNVIGNNNTAVGYATLYWGTGGTNSAFGDSSMLGYNGSNGAGNSAFGYASLRRNYGGDYNTGFGAYALYTNYDGNYNTGIGVNALYSNDSGTNNVAIGYNAGLYETGSNTFYLNNQDRTSNALERTNSLMYGTFNVTPASQTLTINGKIYASVLSSGTGGAGYDAICIDAVTHELTVNTGGDDCVVSSERFKENILDLDLGLSFVNSLQPRVFNYIDSDESRVGFIAEEIEKLDKRLVFYEDDGITPRGVRYQEISAVLVKAIQELDLKINDINNFEKENDWRDNLIAWFSNATNRITRIFTGEICLTNPGEEPVCLNRTELKALKNLINIPEPVQESVSSIPEPEPEPETIPEIIPEPELTPETVLEETIEPTPEPILETTPEPVQETTEPIIEPVPEIISEPILELTPDSVMEIESEPEIILLPVEDLEPIAEPIPESSLEPEPIL